MSKDSSPSASYIPENEKVERPNCDLDPVDVNLNKNQKRQFLILVVIQFACMQSIYSCVYLQKINDFHKIMNPNMNETERERLLTTWLYVLVAASTVARLVVGGVIDLIGR